MRGGDTGLELYPRALGHSAQSWGLWPEAAGRSAQSHRPAVFG